MKNSRRSSYSDINSSLGGFSSEAVTEQAKMIQNILVFGQNSVAFSLLEFLAMSPLLGSNLLIQQGNSFSLILNDFWLESVHESRLDTPWGQTVREFPLFVQRIIQAIYQNEGKACDFDERITFRVFKQIREKIIAQLEEQQVRVIRGKIKSIEPTNNGNELVISINSIDPITVHQDYVINTLTTPRPLVGDAFIKDGQQRFPPQTELYNTALGNAPKELIIIGSGLSALWIKEQCPESTIKYLFKKGASFPSVSRNNHIEVPSSNIYYDDTTQILPIESILSLDNDVPLKQSLLAYQEENELWHMSNCGVLIANSSKVCFVGLVYNATGFVPDMKIIPNAVQAEHIHFQRTGPSQTPFGPKNLPLGALIDRYTHQEARFVKMFNVPQSEHYLFIPLETLFFRPEHLRWFEEYMDSKQIPLTSDFFTQLRDTIIKLEDTPADFLGVIKQVYGNLPSSEQSLREKFNTSLDKMYEDRKALMAKFKSMPEVDESTVKKANDEKILGFVPRPGSP